MLNRNIKQLSMYGKLINEMEGQQLTYTRSSQSRIDGHTT